MIRRIALSLLFLLALSFSAHAAGCTGTGQCFWEGGTGNASDTTKWCTTNTNPCTGATGGLPGSGDNCNFTSVSNATAYTVTVDTTANCKDMTWALPGTSGVPTLALGGQSLLIAGSLTLVATQVVTAASGIFRFTSTTTGKTITSAGVTFAGSSSNMTFDGVGGGWTLQDNLSVNNQIAVINGTLNTNAKTVTAALFVSASGTRTLTLDNSTINITGTSGTVWNVSSAGTLTFSQTGGTININGGTANGNLTISSGGTLSYAGTFNITAAGIIAFQVGSSQTFKNFSYTSTTDKRDSLTFNGSWTIAASGSLTIAGNSVVNRAFFHGATLGSQITITVPNTATVSLTNVDFQDIASAGTFGTWTGTSLGDALGNSGITFDASVTLTLASTGTINWSSATWSSSGAARTAPLPQDDVDLSNSSTATALTADMPRLGRNITAANYLKTWSFASVANFMFGNLTLGASNTLSGTQILTLQGRGSQTITSNTKSFPQRVDIQAFGGTYTAQDNTTTVGQFTLTNGTFDSQGFDLTALLFVSNIGNARTLKATSASTWSFTQTSGTPWNVAGTAPTVTNFSATIKFTGNAPGNITFAGDSVTYANFWWSNTSATGTLIITGANTFADLKINRTTARGLQLPAATTTTIASWTDESLGTAVLTVTSSSAGSAATLRKTSGIVNTDYLSLKDNTATGGAVFFAGSHSSIVSNVTGWNLFGPGGGGLLTLGVGGWLLERDLRPAANDNHPVGVDRAA